MESEGSDPGKSSGEGGCGGILTLIFPNIADCPWLIGEVPEDGLGTVPLARNRPRSLLDAYFKTNILKPKRHKGS